MEVILLLILGIIVFTWLSKKFNSFLDSFNKAREDSGAYNRMLLEALSNRQEKRSTPSRIEALKKANKELREKRGDRQLIERELDIKL